MGIIELENVCRQFKVLNRREGIAGGIKDLFSRDYRYVSAVDDISLEIEKGEIVGYLGPNGAGKSTTIKIMTGVLEPTSGKVLVNGKEPYKNRTGNARDIGVVFGQRSQLWWSLPLRESFKVLKEIYQVSNKDYEDMLDLYMSLIDIRSLLDKQVRQMSLGQRTLSDILAAFLHNPSVVYLDEPTIGLDVLMKSKIRELIKGLNSQKSTTVILTTHDMGDVDALCNRTVIIDKGRKLYDESIDRLHTMFGVYRTLKICFSRDVSKLNQDILQKYAEELEKELHENFPGKDMTVSIDEKWIDILINEEAASLMEVMNFIQQKKHIYNMQLEEISTEMVIKKIYEGSRVLS